MRFAAVLSMIGLLVVTTAYAASAEKWGPLNPPGVMVPDVAREAAVVTDSSGNSFVAFTGISGDLGQSSVYFVPIPSKGEPGRRQVVVPARAGAPSLVRSGETLYLGWLEAVEKRKYQIGCRRSTDWGANWSVPVYVDAGASPQKPFFREGPGRALFIVFISKVVGADQPDTIWCYRSVDQGTTWRRESPEEKAAGMLSGLSPVSSTESFSLVWVESRPQSFDILFNRSDGEKGWLGQPVTVHQSPLPVSQLQIVAGGSELVLFWKETAAGGDKLYSTSSLEGGKMWKAPVEIDGERVRELTYQASVRADNARVISVEETHAGPDRRFQFKVKEVALSKLRESGGAVTSTVTSWSHTYLNRPDFLTAMKGEELLIAAMVQERANSSSLFLIPSGRAESVELVPVTSGQGDGSRTLMALVGFSDGVGILYRQQPPRRFLEETLPGDLMWTRVPLTN